MKIDKVNCYTHINNNFKSKLPAFRYDAVDSFVKMENKFIDAEIDFVRALAKKNSKLHTALKNMDIKKYDVPLLKTLLINPVFDEERIINEIPHMLSVKWPREKDNRLCAAGRKNIADLYATNPVLNQNKAFQAKIGEILSNCTTKESSQYTLSMLDKYLSADCFYKNKYLAEKLPDIIIKMQDSLYDSRIDKRGICKAFNEYLDIYSVSSIDYGYDFVNTLMNKI